MSIGLRCFSGYGKSQATRAASIYQVKWEREVAVGIKIQDENFI